MRLALVVCISVCLLGARAEGAEDDDSVYSSSFRHVTCGSALKLRHVGSGFHLHSHPIRWSSGSGQQSVTAFDGEGDSNSLWQVLDGFGEPACASGAPVACGTIVRLAHVRTGRFLHSHLHASPLSHRQEISGFGDNRQQASDSGDNWRVECTGGAALWARQQPVRLVHVDTGKALFTSRADMFEQSNCPGCPILGQLEVTGHAAAAGDSNALWASADGYFLAAKEAAAAAE